MSIMVDMPPMMVQQVTAYAESRGTTVNSILRNYVAELVKAKGRARLMGAASEFASPLRRSREKGAFRRAMETKHASAR